MVSETLDPSLVQSAKKPRSDQGLNPVPGRRKKLLKGLAYAIFFLASLIFFTVVKIPNSAVANFVLNHANASSTAFNFQAEKLGIRFFPFPHLDVGNLSLEPRFPGAGVPLFFDQLKIYPNPLLGLGATFRADAYKSTVHGAVSPSSLKIESENLDLIRITPLSEIGIDLKGLINALYLQLSVQNQRISTASGNIRITGKNFIFDPTNFGLPVPLPALNLGDLDLQATATNGQVRIDKLKIGSPGKDLEVQVPNGSFTLNDVILNTRFELLLIVKPSPALEKAVPMLPPMLATMATKRPDGFFGIRLAGTLNEVPSIKKE